MAGKDVTILGAGAVGICTALCLQRQGHRVTLVDQDEPGRGCSFGNAGLIQCASVVPLATPGVLRAVPRMLIDPDQPLSIRWRHLPALFPFLVRFAAAATPGQVQRAAAALATIVPRAFEAYQPLLEEAGLREAVRRVGEMHVYESEAAFRQAQGGHDLRRRLGIEAHELSGDEAREREPALGPTVRHAVLLPEAYQTADPYIVVSGLARHFAAHGGEVVRAKVQDIALGEKGPTHLTTEKGALPVENLVVAAGAHSKAFVTRLGSFVPLDSERGYHMTIAEPGIGVRGGVISGDHKIAIVQLACGIRVTGSAELACLDAPPNFRRAERLLPIARRLLPALATQGATVWMGHRPSTPDSLPVIGRSPVHRNVFFAFGHNHSGLTLAAITGRIVSDLISERSPELPLDPFDVDRFTSIGSGNGDIVKLN